MKTKDLRQLNNDELIQKEKNYRKDIFELNGQRQVGAVEKPSRFKLIKREIARILTILKERESNG